MNRANLDVVRRDRGNLVAALQGAGTQVNGKANVKCPFHDDKNPSGSIFQGPDGAWRFRCHTCDVTLDAFDVVGRYRGVDLKAAAAFFNVELDDEGRRMADKPPEPKAGPDLRTPANEAAERLRADEALIERLWTQRAVTRDVAWQECIGVDERKRYWVFPVRAGPGRIVGLKHHRIDPGTEPKCFWEPTGTDSGQLFPARLNPPGPVILCPGELKGLAVLGLGLSAVAPTCGESADLPDRAVELMHGREVAIIGDDDEAGVQWAIGTRDRLRDAGIGARIIDLKFDTSAGVNDITDWLVRELVTNGRPSQDVRAQIVAAFNAADPWRRFSLGAVWDDPATWEPVDHIGTGLGALDKQLGGGLRVGGVHLFTGKTGQTKTTTAIRIAVNAATAGVPVGIISLEMTRQDLGHLIAAQLSDVPRRWIAQGRVWGEAGERLSATLVDRKDLPLTVLDDTFWNGALTRSRLAGIVREGCRRFGWRLVLLDYLGLMAREASDSSEFVADVENSTAIKRIAQRNDIAFVVVAGLRKGAGFKQAPGANKRQSKQAKAAQEVTIDDVIGAGRLVYDAVNVFCVACEQADNGPGSQPTGIVRMVPFKTRYCGAASMGGEIQLRWHPSTGHVTDLEGTEA